jgi:hypothetical protein
LDRGPGENGKTEKWAPLSRKNITFHFFYYYGYPSLLNIDAKKWSLDRRLQDPSIHRR